MLIILDTRFRQLEPMRRVLGTALTPVVWFSDLPSRMGDWAGEALSSREALLEENNRLRARLMVLERRAQKYTALAAENARLRELLNASSAVDERVIVADVVGVTPDPFSHEIIIDKGKSDGVRIGQAVLDAEGLMGQVIHVSAYTARVLLISDSSHAVPVQVNRNGTRAVLVGTGEVGRLELVHVPDTADVRPGDLLVSSGLGGRFPKGYPVATVVRVAHDPGKPFAIVEARPLARLNRSQMVLVVFRQQAQAEPETAAGEQP